ncbi:uncharacterized protein CIMG_06212 [Coccidioides immitis RS]|uniref:Uncharacterized protein n=1 Tax=Coccidioides immitis (strain RS) TaxID=246410 RepID=A0A0E1RVV0_COCIM|nr:uncharacterized protein CIMG_06212 [Coccidioides immitis RS]EAS30733.2 hypothetical protein CIMG_06212 [Coccidioides immitis RS]
MQLDAELCLVRRSNLQPNSHGGIKARVHSAARRVLNEPGAFIISMGDPREGSGTPKARSPPMLPAAVLIGYIIFELYICSCILKSDVFSMCVTTIHR